MHQRRRNFKKTFLAAVGALAVVVLSHLTAGTAAATDNYLAAGLVLESKVKGVAAAQMNLTGPLAVEARIITGNSSQWEGQAKWALLPGVGLSGGVFGFKPVGQASHVSGMMVGVWGETALGPKTIVHGQASYALRSLPGERLLATVGARHHVNDRFFVGAQVTRGLARKDPAVLALVGVGL